MNRSVVTQSAIQPVKYALNEVTSNLAAHVNAPVSKAHGLNLIWLPPGTLDVYGNDIHQYLDDHGDVIGTYHLVFTVDDVTYYAPAMDTALDGQAPFTGISGIESIHPVDTSGPCAWITDITADEISTLNAINEQILIPHTLLAYWETLCHGEISVQLVAGGVADSIGHLIGDHVALMYFNGVQYAIPCCKRLGGMPQSPEILPWNPAYWAPPGGQFSTANNPNPIVPSGATATAVVKGTLPLSFAWALQAAQGSSTWNAVSGTQNVYSTLSPSRHNINVTASGKTFTVNHFPNAEATNQSLIVQFTLTSPVWFPAMTITSTPFEFQLVVNDDDDNCCFCTAVADIRPLSLAEHDLIRRLHSTCFQMAPRLTILYGRHGHYLVDYMLRGGVKKQEIVTFLNEVFERARKGNWAETALFYGRYFIANVRQHWQPKTTCERFHRQVQRAADEIKQIDQSQ